MTSEALTIPHALRIRNVNGYTHEDSVNKAAFHRSAMLWLRKVAKSLNLPADSYVIRSNKGGPAVSGEVTLHGDHIYLQMLESCIGSGGLSIMFRTCKGRRDYCGGRNHFITMQALTDPRTCRNWLRLLSDLLNEQSKG